MKIAIGPEADCDFCHICPLCYICGVARPNESLGCQTVVKHESGGILMSRSALVAMLLSFGVSGAESAELPKSGEDSYTTAYVSMPATAMKLGDRAVSIIDLNGITTNDKGGPMFNNMGTRCLGVRDATGSEVRSRGTCVDTDSDGDQVFSDYEADAKGGVHTFVGGTGKYKGLTGTATYTFTPVKSPEGANRMFIVPHKAKWQRP